VPGRVNRVALPNRPWPIGTGRRSRNLSSWRWMTDLMQLKAGDRGAEIGTGSGYQAAFSRKWPGRSQHQIIEALGKQAATAAGVGYRKVANPNRDGLTAGRKRHHSTPSW